MVCDKKLEISDVIKTPPTKRVEVTYGAHKVECGTVLTPTQVQHKPTIEWEAQPDQLYTLFMIDPDAPSRKEPKYREWMHWWVSNIPGCDVSKGEVVFDYVGAGPPKETGLHRYIFVVYKQGDKMIITDKKHSNT
ncbi:hypothetical protein MXB_5404 [Myxobolus squamalis]|nr:hypothetical protein MXB_5404 [Myxobolus squamalis]